MPDELFVHLELLLSADKITIWSAVGIEPQLLKVFIAYFLKLSGQRTKPVEIREFYYVAEYDCVATVVGLLRFEALKQPDAVYQLTPEQVDLYFDIWNAYLAETPEKLFQLLSSIPDENIVVRALRMLSHRYPQPETNLNYWQLAILESISISSTLDDVYTEVLGFDKQPYDFVNEAYVDYLIRLFCCANAVEVGILPDERPYAATIQLTDYGLNILDGTEKFAFPSDMWVGGALVSSDDFDWRLTAF